MARKRARKANTRASPSVEYACTVSKLPSEILLEIWELLPPVERLCISQACSMWRRLALSTPRLWMRVAVVSGPKTSKPSKSARATKRSQRSIYNPPACSHNLELLDGLLQRSNQLPLDITILWRMSSELPPEIFTILRPHCARISRLHFSTGNYSEFSYLLHYAGSLGLPALRTLTAGFNEDYVEYADLPARLAPDGDLRALRQIHLGARAHTDFFPWWKLALHGVTELTIAPRDVDNIAFALEPCTNLTRLTLVMSEFYANPRKRHERPSVSWVTSTLVGVPELCLVDFPPINEALVRAFTHDARFQSIVLDYQGRVRPPPEPYASLPSPCDALDAPAHLTLTLRDGLYQAAVVDSAQRRREILVGHATRAVAPALWDGFLKGLALASAIVDAPAWDYFSADIPEDCTVPELTIFVLRDPAELDAVSLTQVAGVRMLRVDVLRQGLSFGPDAVPELVSSRTDAASGTSLSMLSLSSNADFGDRDSMCGLADTLEY